MPVHSMIVLTSRKQRTKPLHTTQFGAVFKDIPEKYRSKSGPLPLEVFSLPVWLHPLSALSVPSLTIATHSK
eukprot:521302-Amphidinium_carterae.1